MSRIRLFTLLTACFLVVSAAWADDLGYVDCASHPESAQLFSKARQTPDVLGTVVCGERFTILAYGFVFSRVQTKDDEIGYIYSNLITPDRGGVNASQAAARVPAAATTAPAMASSAQPNAAAKMDSPPATTSTADKPAAQAGPLFPTPPKPAATPSNTASARGQADSQAQSAAVQPAPAELTSSSSTSPQPSSPAPTGPLFPNPPQPAPPAPPLGAADAAPAAARAASPVPASTEDSVPAAAAAGPASPAAASHEAAEPARDPVPSVSVRSSWERPLPGVHQSFLVELYSGYAFDRVSGAGVSSNLQGGMGSFGYNLKPWLQIVGDTSYNVSPPPVSRMPCTATTSAGVSSTTGTAGA